MKYRDAKITVVHNGFIVEIGCAKVVAENPDSLLKLIKNYLNDPIKAEKEMWEKTMVYINPSPPSTGTFMTDNYGSIPNLTLGSTFR
jgi:hypothetical protein